MPVNVFESGIITNKEGETVILLPPGPIRSKIEGSSGVIYAQTLVDDPHLGRPTHKIVGEQIIPTHTQD